MIILEPSDQATAAIGKRVTVVDHPDGRLSIRYNGVKLAYHTFDKLRQVSQAAILENKRLGVRSPLSARSSCVANLSVAVGHAGAISRTPASSRSAEPFYEPSGLIPLSKPTGAVSNVRPAGAGRALRYAGAPRPPAARPQPY